MRRVLRRKVRNMRRGRYFCMTSNVYISKTDEQTWDGHCRRLLATYEDPSFALGPEMRRSGR